MKTTEKKDEKSRSGHVIEALNVALKNLDFIITL